MVDYAQLIYNVYERREERQPQRKHALGASVIGQECERAIWYGFRLCAKKKFNGRVLRLFRRGEDAEPQFIEELQEAGFEVLQFDKVLNFDKDGQQFRRTSCDGHFSVNIDGQIRLTGKWSVLEFKTHNDKSYKELVKIGVREAKPEHFAQCIVGAGLMNLEGTLYLAENKNTSEIYAEYIPFDQDCMRHYWEKARRIIAAHDAPDRLNNRPDFFRCRWCDYADLCHHDQPALVNCYTCCHSTPVADGQWSCALAERVIPSKVAMRGCPEHIYLPSLLPWRAVDADEGYVLYENGVCNVGSKGFPPVHDGDPPVLFSSKELCAIENLGNINAVCKTKEVFGGQVLTGDGETTKE